MKATKKTTVKPCFIVNLTEATDSRDIRFEFIKAKALKGVKIEKDDILFLLTLGADIAFEMIDDKLNEFYAKCDHFEINDEKTVKSVFDAITKAVAPKKPWYKRFWGWITKPFRVLAGEE